MFNTIKYHSLQPQKPPKKCCGCLDSSYVRTKSQKNAIHIIFTVFLICLFAAAGGVTAFFGQQKYNNVNRLYNRTTFTVIGYNVTEHSKKICRDCDYGMWDNSVPTFPITCDHHNYSSRINLWYPVYREHNNVTVEDVVLQTFEKSAIVMYFTNKTGLCGDSRSNAIEKDSNIWPVGTKIAGWYLLSDPNVVVYNMQDGAVLFLGTGLFAIACVILIIYCVYNHWWKPRYLVTKYSMVTINTENY
jgi:hypothetical protein